MKLGKVASTILSTVESVFEHVRFHFVQCLPGVCQWKAELTEYFLCLCVDRPEFLLQNEINVSRFLHFDIRCFLFIYLFSDDGQSQCYPETDLVLTNGTLTFHCVFWVPNSWGVDLTGYRYSNPPNLQNNSTLNSELCHYYLAWWGRSNKADISPA